MFLNADFARQVHRSGWLDVSETLADIETDCVIDLYLDASYGWRDFKPQTRPWIGFVHHPTQGDHGSEWLCGLPAVRESLPHCKGLITLSEHLAQQIRQCLSSTSIPVFVLHHPTVFSHRRHDLSSLYSDKPTIVHVGNWQRDVAWFVNKLEAPGFTKKILNGPLDTYRKEYPDIALGCLEHLQYDKLLASSVVAIKLHDASAVNTIVECIVRNTPIYINRLPAVEEYLGSAYPLYHDCMDAVSLDGCKAAHTYLKNLDKKRLRHATFRRDFLEILKTLKIPYTAKPALSRFLTYGGMILGRSIISPFTPVGRAIYKPVSSKAPPNLPFKSGHNFYA